MVRQIIYLILNLGFCCSCRSWLWCQHWHVSRSPPHGNGFDYASHGDCVDGDPHGATALTGPLMATALTVPPMAMALRVPAVAKMARALLS